MAATQTQFPTTVTRDPADLRRGYSHVDYEVSKDPRYHFSFVLPVTWRVESASLITPSPDDPLQVPASFVCNGRQRARIDVLTIRLTRDVAPADWLELFIEERGAAVLDQRRFPSPCGPTADILSRIETRHGVFVSRWLAVKDGDALFIVQCCARESDYPDHADDFFTALATFRLLHPLDWPFAEPVHVLDLPDARGLSLVLPKSWPIQRDPHSHSNVISYQVTNEINGSAIGALSVAGVARAAESNAENLAAAYARGLQRARVGICRIALASGGAQGPFDAVWQGSAEALQRGKKLEVRVFVGHCELMWLFAGLAGPARQTHAGAWALNKRGFEILVDYAHFAADDQPTNESTTPQEIMSGHGNKASAP